MPTGQTSERGNSLPLLKSAGHQRCLVAFIIGCFKDERFTKLHRAARCFPADLHVAGAPECHYDSGAIFEVSGVAYRESGSFCGTGTAFMSYLIVLTFIFYNAYVSLLKLGSTV
jgi:hypothetical protein